MPIEAIKSENRRLILLDQTCLPDEVKYLSLDDYRDVISAIKCLSVRGAPAIGIAGAFALALAATKSERYDLDYLKEVGLEIATCRPTAVNLSCAVNRVLDRFASDKPITLPDSLDLLWREAEAIHEEDRQMCRRIGEFGAQLIEDGANVLTHCNAGALATGGIGTALAAIYVANEQGKRIHVYADETRPLLQGARLTMWELAEARIDCTLIVDSVAAMLMRQGKISQIIVGADRIAANGDTANKIGTYSLAVQAEKHSVPFYIAAPMTTFDLSIATGEQIVIEERSEDEVTHGFGRRTAPESVSVYAPAFDVTPVGLITAYITDQGIRPGGRKSN